MNVLRNSLGMRDKRVYWVLGLLLALLLPVLSYQSWYGLKNLSRIEDKLETARKIRAHKRAYTAKVRAYQTFTSEVQTFIQEAHRARILKNDWVIYEVDIKDRLVNLNAMRTFLDNAQSSERYYFRPDLLQITSLYAEQLLSPDILDQLGAASQGGQPSAGQSAGGASAGSGSPVGKQVLLTLKGTYMVKRP